ncbi:MAG: hypothetical protein FI698_00560 [SAR202 cluster bacterium]|nr:hypothetical protein [SAR202 cluster bacterium]
MNNQSNMSKVLAFFSESKFCNDCDTRIRFGDIDCPHCGCDLDDLYMQWAHNLLKNLNCEEEN